jgi:hypothetical protein
LTRVNVARLRTPVCRSIATALSIRNQSITPACVQRVAQRRRYAGNRRPAVHLPTLISQRVRSAGTRVAKATRVGGDQPLTSHSVRLRTDSRLPSSLPPPPSEEGGFFTPQAKPLRGFFARNRHAVVMPNLRRPGRGRAWSACLARTTGARSCAHNDLRTGRACHPRRRCATNARRA